MGQPLAVAFTAFANVWPRATETEIGAALCAIGAGKDFDFDFDLLSQLYFTLYMYFFFLRRTP